MRSSLRTLLVAVLGLTALSLATPTRRAPTLEVSLSAPKSIESLDHAKVDASVTNTGTEAVKIIKYSTVLDASMPTRSFKVTKTGKEVTFTGIILSLVDVEKFSEDTFVVLSPGAKYTVTHDVSALYDFEGAGVGTFNFEPVTNFQVFLGDATTANSTKTPADVVGVSAAAIDVEITKDVAKRELKPSNKRAIAMCTNSARRQFMKDSYIDAKELAALAENYIASYGAGPVFKSYFKTSSTAKISKVFNLVKNEGGLRTLNCYDLLGGCDKDVIAYTWTLTTDIFYCPPFWTEVPSQNLCSSTTVGARNVRGGTALHELTHATSGTDDVNYGCAGDQTLSASNAARNADNYNCFATQVYQLTRC